MSLKEWVKIAVGLREHPKVLEAGDDAGWLFVCSLMWSKEHDTDGAIPGYAVERLNGLKGRRLAAAVHKVVAVGLWEVTDSGFRIHDYLDHQESSERRKAAAKKAAEARWGAEKGMRSASDSHPHRIADRNANAMRDRNAEKRREEEEIPPSPPRGNRARDLDDWKGQAVAYAASAGVTGRPESVIRAVEQAARFHRFTTHDEFRAFARLSFPALSVVADLPDSRSAA